MIEVQRDSEFGRYTEKLNHGHIVFDQHGGIGTIAHYICIDVVDAYVVPEDVNNWNPCPCCGLKPLIWVFDNGRSTACGCGNNRYDHFSVHAESIMSVLKRTGGSAIEYDCDELRRNWNEYCQTMINPCSHGDLIMEDKW